MSLLCSLSGNIATRPVINPRNGRIYDHHSIQQYLLTSDNDPITKDSLKFEDLIPIHSSSLSLPPFLTSSSPSSTTSSLSSLLSSLTNEFDGLMLEQFTLKKEIYSLKQELAHSLYQYDAACRVIARLIKERDEARSNNNNNSLSSSDIQSSINEEKSEFKQNSSSTIKSSANSHQNQNEMEIDHQSNSSDDSSHSTFTRILTECAEFLSGKGGKKRKSSIKSLAATIPSKEILKNIQLKSSFVPQSNQSSQSILAMDVDYNYGANGLTTTGNNEGIISVYDCNKNELLHSIQGHKKRITDLTFIHPSSYRQSIENSSSLASNSPLPILSSSSDGSISLHVYNNENNKNNYETKYNYSAHTGSVSLNVHPSAFYYISAGLDGLWFINDINTGKQIISYNNNTSNENGFNSCKFHPDGRIVGLTVTDLTMKIFDVSSAVIAASFTGHKSEPLAISFSPNGYHAATGDSDGIIKLWDLRYVGAEKPANFANIETNAAVNDLTFDEGAKLLFTATGNQTKIYDAKTLEEIFQTNPNDSGESIISAVRVGLAAKKFHSASKDGKINIYETPSNETKTMT